MKNLVLIPAYNEEQALPGTLAALQSLPNNFEIVIINDGSQDKTGDVAAQLARTSAVPLRVINLPLNSGIGVAMQTGFLYAAKDGQYHYVIQFDADGQHDATYIQKLVAECESKNLDLCIGSRFLAAQAGDFQSTFARRLGIRFFSRLISVLSGMRVTDPTSGFRCAGPRAWRHFAECYPDDYPEPESLFWCARNGLNVGEIPTRMRERQGGVSSIRYFKTVYYMLKVSLAILVDRLRIQEHDENER
ncbi:MAG: glycosyltransferase family 2 protein [Planctomycetota bacterium]